MKKAAALAALVLALLASGCGIPDNTEVSPLRPGPSTGVTSGVDATTPQAKRDDTTDPGQFVKNYLTAAAGEFDGAADRVKEFLSPAARASFPPQADVMRVVRLIEEPLVNPGSAKVSLRVREVGTLRQKGIFEPSADAGVNSIQLEVGDVPGRSGLFVVKAPPFLLITDDALARFYEPRTIYFWNQDHTGLIPDGRYLERSVPAEQVPTQILDWLTNGQAQWLDGVAEALPEGTKPIGNVPAISNQTLQISLSGQALPPDEPVAALDRLQKQLRWSLWPDVPATLELTIEHSADERYSGTDYFTANAAYRPIAEPERFVVYDGQIRRLSDSYNAGRAVPVVRVEDNKNVRMAALAVSGGRGYAALVVNDPGGGQSLRVGASAADATAPLRQVKWPVKSPASIGRPVWAKSAVGADGETAGLVTSAGRLYSFTPGGGVATEVLWPGGPPGAVTAVAVAPDAHRAAIIAGGNLFVAALSRTDDGMQLTAPHVVRTRLGSLSAVDWSSEGSLVLAGQGSDERVAIWEVSVDGTQQTPRQGDLGQNPVTYMASLPDSPIRGAESTGALAYVQAKIAYDDEDRRPITVQDLAVPVAHPRASVQPEVPVFLG